MLFGSCVIRLFHLPYIWCFCESCLVLWHLVDQCLFGYSFIHCMLLLVLDFFISFLFLSVDHRWHEELAWIETRIFLIGISITPPKLLSWVEDAGRLLRCHPIWCFETESWRFWTPFLVIKGWVIHVDKIVEKPSYSKTHIIVAMTRIMGWGWHFSDSFNLWLNYIFCFLLEGLATKVWQSIVNVFLCSCEYFSLCLQE